MLPVEPIPFEVDIATEERQIEGARSAVAYWESQYGEGRRSEGIRPTVAGKTRYL